MWGLAHHTSWPALGPFFFHLTDLRVLDVCCSGQYSLPTGYFNVIKMEQNKKASSPVTLATSQALAGHMWLAAPIWHRTAVECSHRPRHLYGIALAWVLSRRDVSVVLAAAQYFLVTTVSAVTQSICFWAGVSICGVQMPSIPEPNDISHF